MANQESWAALLKMYFNCDIKGATEASWFSELRNQVSGWAYNEAREGSNMLKGPRAGEINAELCDVIRYINGLDSTPRKNRGQSKNESKGKITIADLQLWVFIYRKNKNKSAGYEVSEPFVEAGKLLIQRCIDKGEDTIAALVATGDPYAADLEDRNEFFSDLGNRSFSEQEMVMINDFCISIGFNPYQVFTKDKRWLEYKQSRGRTNPLDQVSEIGKDFL